MEKNTIKTDCELAFENLYKIFNWADEQLGSSIISKINLQKTNLKILDEKEEKL